MHEASREYKYNRQIFDQKARSMTEKYAEIGASKVQNIVQGRQTLPNPNIESAEAEGSDASMMSIQDHFVSHKRLCGISRKLSLESSESDQKTNDGKLVNEVPISNLYDREREIMGVKQESKATLIEHNKTHTKLQETRKKLSLELLVPVQKENDGNMIDVMPTSSLSQPQVLLKDSSKSWPLVQPGFSSQQNPPADKDRQPTSNSKATRLKGDLQKPLASRQGIGEDDKKLCFAPQQPASGSHQTPLEAQTISHQNEKEHNHNVADGHGSSLSRIKHKKLGLSGRRLSREQLGGSQRPQKDNKENMAPNSSFPLSHIQKNPTLSSIVSETSGCYNISVQISTNSSHNLCGTQQWKTLSPLVESNDIRNNELQLKTQSEYPSMPPNMQKESCNDKKQQSKDCDERFAAGIKNQEQASSSDDAVIVLDSEDGEEEQGRTTRSRLSLARRCLPGKRKS